MPDPVTPELVGNPVVPSRILIVSDAWHPQVNGVVRTLDTVVSILRRDSHVVEVIGPDRFRTVPCPTYPEIRLALAPRARLKHLIDTFRPDALHVATEGPLGFAASGLARDRGWRFTTAFHTRFPEYLAARFRIPVGLGYALLRRFHNRGAGIMVATASLGAELERRGFERVRRWSRGVDLSRFSPEPREAWDGLERPVFVAVGRVAIEKNLEAFLRLDLPGSKVVVGDGPSASGSRAHFPRSASRESSPRTGCPRPMRARTSSCSRPGPTRSAWSCWRRWHPASRSRPSR